MDLLLYLVRKEEVDVCGYPDTGKINILPWKELFLEQDAKDYFYGEDAVRSFWPEEGDLPD